MKLYVFFASLLMLAPSSCFPTPLERTPTAFPTPSSLGIGSTMISDKDSMLLVYVPAGRFTMGGDIYADEQPIHQVYLDAFWIDQTEVTVHMYSLCAEAGVCAEPVSTSSSTHPSYYGNVDFDNYPVIYVDWRMAKNYCEWAGRRLPTEAEWEKAARGTNGRKYPWGEEINCSLANYWGKENGCVGDTTEVGSYLNGASMYGALDMAGNVWEWVSSLYHPYPYDSEDGRENPASPNPRVVRGGSWFIHLTVHSSLRSGDKATNASEIVGFRCTVNATP